ncbi:hypothetical protein [Paraliomyxa miuraensis]|uniref:hypothetical protein n=1 Tax=Paraliomyxa miuraensis TaxID=376150 RepID=UPI00225526E9|nr:hypothetical protein [Paraliomyxa miuraensis]MCX4242878.1 hypothetical protein [Paraliomyxa miuraensis]
MRFDLEQFLALTMALGTAGALGVAVYSSQDATAASPQSVAAPPDGDEPFPEAEDEPAPRSTENVALAPAPEPTPVPALDAAPEELEAAPGPQVETMIW